MAEARGNRLTLTACMVGLTLILYFLPLINGLAGGMVGGFLAGNRKSALEDAGISIILVSLLLGLVFMLMPEPVLGLFGKSFGFALILLADIGILAGAWMGGMFAEDASQNGPHRVR